MFKPRMKVILVPGLLMLVFVSGCKKSAPVQLAAIDAVAPATVSSVIKLDSKSRTQLQVSWTKAEDQFSLQSDLSYRVYYSSANNIASVVDMEKNGTAVSDFSQDISSTQISGLSCGNTYFINILVKDLAGNKAAYSPLQQSTVGCCYPGGECLMYLTALATNGSFGGVVGADNYCNIDLNKPSHTGSFKAFLGSSTRRACTMANCSGGPWEHMDWVLYPSTTYSRSDGTLVARSNQNGIITMLINPISGGSYIYWTGLASNYTASADNCNNWMSSDSLSYFGSVAEQGHTVPTGTSGYNGCLNMRRLLCVEQ